MTQTPDSTPEPTNGDLMAFMREGFAHLTVELAKTNAKVDELGSRFDELGSRFDVAETSLRSEIRASEARVTNRINAVQDVVRSAKADHAAHLDDPNAHHRRAA